LPFLVGEQQDHIDIDRQPRLAQQAGGHSTDDHALIVETSQQALQSQEGRYQGRNVRTHRMRLLRRAQRS